MYDLYGGRTMVGSLAINERLLDEAYKIGGDGTKKKTINTALKEFIQRRKSEDLIKLFGQIEYDPKYDYKKMRLR